MTQSESLQSKVRRSVDPDSLIFMLMVRETWVSIVVNMCFTFKLLK